MPASIVPSLLRWSSHVRMVGDPSMGTHLGFGRIVVSEIEVPNMLVNLV
jgi:hypothetical protein